jgi:hypothetical protein
MLRKEYLVYKEIHRKSPFFELIKQIDSIERSGNWSYTVSVRF